MSSSVKQKLKRRTRIKRSIRRKISGTAERPRLSVFRSNKEIYGQVINDLTGETLLSLSSMSKDFKDAKGSNSEIAEKVGEQLAKMAVEKNIETIIFDRNGYLYHGRVKAFADGARKGGLKF